jgi:hypothetical protein
MVVIVPPLITRLRRRIAATAWLFAFVVLAKATLATACMGDGTAESTVTTAGVVDAVAAHPALASDSDDTCFHAGSTGCHCACAHGAALAVDASTVIAPLLASIPLPSISSHALLAPRSTTLRPPIV